MLVYLATYPRSGNSLLQRMMLQNFWVLPTQVKAAPRPDQALPKLDGWKIQRDREPARGSPESGLWAPQSIIYRREAAGEPWRRGLTHVPARFFTEERRRMLASDSEVYCVKTHHLPFESYLDGERVIQVVRRPGPTLASYFRLLASGATEDRDLRVFNRPPPTLDRIIAGDVQFGSWGAYHTQWGAAARALGKRHLRLHFTKMSEDQASARDAIGRFLHLPVRETQPVNFERYQAKHPGLNPRGADEGFEAFYTRRQLTTLWEIHGLAARALGFPPPDVDLAGQDEQTNYLNDLIEAAWAARGSGAQAQ